MDNGHLSIGKLAKKSATSVRMLRYFEKFGLLKPIRHGLRRFYHPDDRNHVAVIRVYQSLGLNLKTVRDLRRALATGAKDEATKISMAAAARADREIEKLEKQRFFLARLQTKLSKDQLPHSYHCFLCNTRNDDARKWWGAMLDLFCEPCIERLHAEIGLTPGDTQLRCTACGNVGKSPSMPGTDGSICHDCLKSYVSNINRAKCG